MKLHFEDDLDYQKAAIESVVNLFKGQEISRSEFTVTFQPDSSPTSHWAWKKASLVLVIGSYWSMKKLKKTFVKLS